jgi:pimeloyl-ACP methyl ester carboxylesterase
MRTVVRLAGWAVAIVVVLGLIGFVTLSRADIPYAALRAQYGTPADRYLDLPSGVQLHYRDQGNQAGEAIVLVHGFGASLFDWQDWVARLGGQYRVISLDLPGHGLTSAPKHYQAHMDDLIGAVDALTTHLGVKHFVLVGNSMGGGVAWNYALQHPDQLDGLVLEDSVPAPNPSAQPQRGKSNVIIFNLMQAPLLRGVLTHIDLTPLVRQGLESAMVDKSLVTPALVKRYSDFSRAPGHRVILLNLQGGAHPDPAAVNAALGRLKVPTLVMHGKVDKLIAVGEGERTARTIPGATLILYDGVGHVPMEQIPDKSAADLDHWIKSKSLASGTWVKVTQRVNVKVVK